MPEDLIQAVIFGFGLVAIQLASAATAKWRSARQPNTPVLPHRLPPRLARAALSWQIALAAFLYVSCEGSWWSADSVGYRLAYSPAVSSAIGVVVLGFSVFAYGLTTSLLGLRVLHEAALRTNRRMWPRDKRAKILMGACLFLNPVTEELLMRGLLIHQFGLLLGSSAIPIAIGLMLNAAEHSYQGWLAQGWHVLFFLMAVSLLYSPAGLAGAIGAHAAADMVPILMLRRHFQRLRHSRSFEVAGAAFR